MTFPPKSTPSDKPVDHEASPQKLSPALRAQVGTLVTALRRVVEAEKKRIASTDDPQPIETWVAKLIVAVEALEQLAAPPWAR
jgi:hypothetical protein